MDQQLSSFLLLFVLVFVCILCVYFVYVFCVCMWVCECVFFFWFFFFLVMKNTLHSGQQQKSIIDTSEEHSIPTNGDARVPKNPRKKNKTRTFFDEDEVDKLELAFMKSKYIAPATKRRLASDLSTTEDRIKVHYDNC